MKKLILTLFIASFTSLAFGQWGEEEMSDKPTLKDRIFIGGGFGMGFNNYSDYVSISPIVGYKLTPRLAGGIGLQYSYIKYKQYTPAVVTNNFGGSVFLRYNFYGPLFLHTEYEYLNYQFSEKVRQGFNSFMAGGGLSQPIGKHAGLYFMALYNFSYQNADPINGQYSVYNSPWVIRAGITAGF